MAHKKKTVLVVTGTRAEYGLLKPIIDALAKSKYLTPRVLATGMHTLKKFGYTVNEIRKDGVPVAAVVPIRESSIPTALGMEIRGIEAYASKHRPDLIMVLGDRHEAFAGAIVGAHLGIPVAHIHGGDVSGEVDDSIRHATTKLSHIHFAATPKSAARIRQLGEAPWRVHVVGAPGVARFKHMTLRGKAALAARLKIDASKKWLLAIFHPASHEGVPIPTQAKKFFAALERFPEMEKIIVYPNADEGSQHIVSVIKTLRGKAGFHIFKNVERENFAGLLQRSSVIVGNSSAGIIEAGYFRLPAVNVGNREFGRERGGNVIDVGLDTKEIAAAITRALSPAFTRRAAAKNPYATSDSPQKIVRIAEKMLFSKRDLLRKELTHA